MLIKSSFLFNFNIYEEIYYMELAYVIIEVKKSQISFSKLQTQEGLW